ncbi:MAG: hypothetical protein J6O73_02130 [Lachnospiraceae bacterium]|nr:hypothetical protein [Lachnospiraceae bacterium]
MTTNEVVAIQSEVLTKIFLEMLNREGLIGNNTYLNAVEENDKKGEDDYVVKEYVQRGTAEEWD